MTKRTTNLASGVLLALLCAQGVLGMAGVTLAIMKNRMLSQPALINVALVDADAAKRR